MSEETAEYHVTPKSTSTPKNLAEIVSDIQKNLDPALKEEIANIPKGAFIQFYMSWGNGIRDKYNLWHNEELVKALGANHAGEASMVIINAVWRSCKIQRLASERKGKL